MTPYLGGVINDPIYLCQITKKIEFLCPKQLLN